MSIIATENLSKAYGGQLALKQVSINIEKGKIVGLLGPNSSGKTTLIKLINGLLQPDGGQVLIHGLEPSPASKGRIAYLPDHNTLPDWMTVKEILDFYADFFEDFRRDRAEEMLGTLNIDPKARIKTLSKGTIEKVQLIITMARKADVYILDEPIAGVDPAARDYILRTILSNYDEDSSILLSTHLIADVESIFDEVIFLKDGQVYLQGAVDDLRAEHHQSIDGLFREVFKC